MAEIKNSESECGRGRTHLRFKKLTFDVKLLLKLENDRVLAGCSCGLKCHKNFSTLFKTLHSIINTSCRKHFKIEMHGYQSKTVQLMCDLCLSSIRSVLHFV